MDEWKSTTDDKADDFLKLDRRYVTKLTTVIEANREIPDLTILNSHAIELKTQHVREIETELHDISYDSGTYKAGKEQPSLTAPKADRSRKGGLLGGQE